MAASVTETRGHRSVPIPQSGHIPSHWGQLDGALLLVRLLHTHTEGTRPCHFLFLRWEARTDQQQRFSLVGLEIQRGGPVQGCHAP